MIGQTISHYRIVEKLGGGGMGVVYKAHDSHLGRTVAIKLLPPEKVADAERKRRFVQEAKAASALNHPSIITIYDIDQADGIDFIAMEYVAGKTLAQLIGGGRLPLAETLKYAIQMADALAQAHKANIIHRDLKPANVMVTEAGLVKVLDFGLAKLSQPAEDDSLGTTATMEPATQEGVVLGTVAYMSPEQVEGKKLDVRSDVFSFGAILYEMLTGERAFQGDSTISIMSAILRDTPASPRKTRPEVHRDVERLLAHCLEKNREARYTSGVELLAELRALESRLFGAAGASRSLWQALRRPRIAVPTIISLLALCLAGISLYQRNAKVRWARERGLPEIERLAGEEKYVAAFRLAQQAEKYVPRDPALLKLWPQVSRTISIVTKPPDAEVWFKNYRTPDAPWEYVGRSPINHLRVPQGFLRWKLEKRDLATVEGMGITADYTDPPAINIVLDEAQNAPPGMVRVSWFKNVWTELSIFLAGLEHVKGVPLPDYWIDKYEVTNKQFKEFVDRGGYEKREYWKYPFVEDERILPWEQASARFRDETGRPGPATWKLGEFPRGQEAYPVRGVSWYEAAAYAEFAGRSLPTIFHWAWAAGLPWSDAVVPFSNFAAEGPAAAETFKGMSPYGTYDMAGNVKEWCWNLAGSGKRYSLGGAWNEPLYMFNSPDALSPFDRAPNQGFRCAKYLGPLPQNVTDPISPPSRDYQREKPVSDDVFRLYRSLYSYDRTPLNPKIEPTSVSGEGWNRERISFDAAYGKERVLALLFLPKKSKPPFQAVILFPGSDVIYLRSSDLLETWGFDFILKSGRAVLYPIYKGTFERGDGLQTDVPATTSFYRDHMILWAKDMRRSMDYLETRPEIDRNKVGFYGISWGGALGAILPAIENRLKVSVLALGGFWLAPALPEVDQLNFAPRVTIPTLMLNGRYDFFFPVETSQLPMFRLLGTPKEHKRHKLYDSAHMIPFNEWVKETLNWLDRYLGPVR